MADMKPLYTPANTTFAFQLNWSLDLFWKQPPPPDTSWLGALSSAVELDGARLLKHKFLGNHISQFLLSTRPETSPQDFARSVKGRLQHLLQHTTPKAFSRNYCFRSLGSSRREVIERYVQNQLRDYGLADARTEKILDGFQIYNPEIDLSKSRKTSHSVYWYNLHLVLVHEARWKDVDRERLSKTKEMIIRVCRSRNYLLSRAGMLPDHLHLALSCPSEKSPQDTALCFMNNIAFACDMRLIFQPGYFIGTFGEYDLSAIPKE